MSLELQLEKVGGALVLRGIALGTVGDVEVETAATGVHASAVDDQGWFRVEGLPDEPVRVRVQSATGTAVTTGWLRG